MFGKVIEVGKPLPEPEPVEWSGCVEIRKSAKSGTVRYMLKFAYEKGALRRNSCDVPELLSLG